MSNFILLLECTLRPQLVLTWATGLHFTSFCHVTLSSWYWGSIGLEKEENKFSFVCREAVESNLVKLKISRYSDPFPYSECSLAQGTNLVDGKRCHIHTHSDQ